MTKNYLVFKNGAMFLLLLFFFNMLFAQNKILNFDGLNDYVNCGNDASLQITDEITVEAWARYDDVTLDWTRIVTKGMWDGEDRGWMFFFTDSDGSGHTGLLFTIRINGDARGVSIPNTEIEEGVWYHLAASYDGEFLRIFVNGVQKEISPSFPGTMTETSGPFNVLIGQSEGVNNEPFKGAMDEVRIWNKALDETIISAWKNKMLDNTHPNWSNLQGYWNFDDGTDPTTDDSDNSNWGDVEGAFFEISDGPLPIVLSAFTAIQTEAGFAQIEWTTQSEMNIQGYNIYRSSEKTFESAIKLNPEIILGTNNTSEQNYSFIDERVEPETYYYWLESVETSGETTLFYPISIIIEDQPDNPTPPITIIAGLHQNYPNPFNPETAIKFALEESGNAELTVYNLKGQKVITLFKDYVNANEYVSVKWRGIDEQNRKVGSGIYLYKFKTGTKEDIKTMLLLK